MATTLSAASLQALLAAAGGAPATDADPTAATAPVAPITPSPMPTPDNTLTASGAAAAPLAIEGPGSLRPALGQRRLPQYSASLAALQRAVY